MNRGSLGANVCLLSLVTVGLGFWSYAWPVTMNIWRADEILRSVAT
jgi:hypothetical protein